MASYTKAFLAWWRLDKAVYIMALILLSLFFYWGVYPYDPVSSTGQIVVTNEGKSITSGESIVTLWDIKKNTNIRPEVERQIICESGFVQQLTSQQINLDQGNNVYRLMVALPAVIPPDVCQVHWTAVYQMNPIRQVTEKFTSEKFEVL
jgi:hypothetical protein